MIYVEFYDRVSLENIAVCLSREPEQVVIIGEGPELAARIANYKELFLKRYGREIEIKAKSINKTNFLDAVKQLRHMLHAMDDVVFDITGGDEVLVLALGRACAAFPDKKIHIQKMNLRDGTVYDCDCDGVTVFEQIPQLSIDENILIYGGLMTDAKGDIDARATYAWDMTPDFRNDVGKMWELCKARRRYWNVMISILSKMCENTSCNDLTVSASISAVNADLRGKGVQYYPDKQSTDLYSELMGKNLLTQYEVDGDTVTVSFKNPQVKKCLTTEGLALEMKMYTIAKDACENGQPVYNDVRNGVTIDWDGQDDPNQKYEVENEIDVMMMHGVVPVFVSCKNGDCDANEIYKLETVARRFGGPYARMALIAPNLEPTGSEKANYPDRAVLKQERADLLFDRAEQAGIRVLKKEILYANDHELEELLSGLWRD